MRTSELNSNSEYIFTLGSRAISSLNVVIAFYNFLHLFENYSDLTYSDLIVFSLHHFQSIMSLEQFNFFLIVQIMNISIDNNCSLHVITTDDPERTVLIIFVNSNTRGCELSYQSMGNLRNAIESKIKWFCRIANAKIYFRNSAYRKWVSDSCNDVDISRSQRVHIFGHFLGPEPLLGHDDQNRRKEWFF